MIWWGGRVQICIWECAELNRQRGSQGEISTKINLLSLSLSLLLPYPLNYVIYH